MLEQKRMYSYEDMDIMLCEIRENYTTKEKYLDLVDKYAKGHDAIILNRAVGDFVAEDFMRYDSDVSEQFIYIYKKFRGWN